MAAAGDPGTPAEGGLQPRRRCPGDHLHRRPLLTVAGIAVFGPVGNLLFAGGLGLVGALAFVLNPAPRAASTDRRRDTTARSSVRSPIRIPAVARVAALTFGIGFPVGTLTIVATATETARADAGLAGWILAVNAVGALIGATAVGIRPLGSTPERLLALCGVLLAVGYLPLAVTGLPTTAYLVAAGVSGLMLPPTLGQVFERIGQLSPPDALTEANGWVVSAMTLGIGGGTLVAGAVVGAEGTSAVAWIVLGTSAVTALLALVALPRRSDLPR